VDLFVIQIYVKPDQLDPGEDDGVSNQIHDGSVILLKEWDVEGIMYPELHTKQPDQLPQVLEEPMCSKVTLVLKGVVKYVAI
jgi:hypothetical protein